MEVTLRFSDTPEDLVYGVNSAEEMRAAMLDAWTYVGKNVTFFACQIMCPEELSNDWETVIWVLVPPKLTDILVYSFWKDLLAKQRSLIARSEMIKEARYYEEMGCFNVKIKDKVIPFPKK